jgi:elongation factor Ts
MIDKIQKLRDVTGAGVMDCRNALNDSSGDFDRALTIIKEKGLARAGRRAGRETSAGVLEAYVHNSRVGVLLELRCETDFVARADIFISLAHKLVMQITAMNPQDIVSLMKQRNIKDESQTVEDLVKSVMANVGENIEIARFCRYEL